MAFRRLLAKAAAQGLLFACGIGLMAALQARFYACATVMGLVAAWVGGGAVWSARRETAARLRRETAEPAALQADHRLLASLLDQTPVPLLVLGADGVLRARNRAARTLFHTDEVLIAPPPGLLDGLHDGEPGRRSTFELETGADANTYALSITDVLGPQGPVRLAALLDIQSELRAAEAAALRDILQVLSHEIMNALTPVSSLAGTAVELLSDGTHESAVLALDAVQVLARRADGLTRFVEAYRTLARLPPPNLQPTEIGPLVDEVARLFHSRWDARGVTLKADGPAAELVVSLDTDLTIHAVLNILSNAAEAALDADDGAAAVWLVAEREATGVKFTVTDSGDGVRPADQEKIFQPFFTTKAAGTGVGLSFARQVALSHGGDLTLAPARPGQGASFELRL